MTKTKENNLNSRKKLVDAHEMKERYAKLSKNFGKCQELELEVLSRNAK